MLIFYLRIDNLNDFLLFIDECSIFIESRSLVDVLYSHSWLIDMCLNFTRPLCWRLEKEMRREHLISQQLQQLRITY